MSACPHILPFLNLWARRADGRKLFESEWEQNTGFFSGSDGGDYPREKVQNRSFPNKVKLGSSEETSAYYVTYPVVGWKPYLD